ncbi:VIT domain-containing protein [Candidatus Uabimicrobium amorphum]|uniref:Inter-alpha-trypsin inhibitor domain-containing protein n=1 Tax=Uabimicrobium amorphum TaxID=2596890 RepID=A0A5S9ILU7_UABAM|nr:VIT domain-containing protein [Candidatus Uabimicrobium amorphum]BBM84268.1 inter-alpha-trypsin inhibitor domain-containing protein [Candidatus Uabimicrobium amorphum]
MKKSVIYLAVALLSATVYARVIPNIPNTTIRPTITLLPIQAKTHTVTTKIKNNIAITTLETEYYNPNNRVLEGTYLFALPKGASVGTFSLWINGKEMPAELLDAKKAEDLYVSIVRKMIDPALLEFVGRETFKMRIFPFPARGSRKIKLTYQQVLSADNNLVRYEYPLTAVGNGHNDTIQNFSCNIEIEAQNAIKSVFSPTHDIKIKKQGKTASVSFSGNHINTDRDFVLYMSNSNKRVDLSFIPFAKKGKKGHFLMMLSPKTKVDASEINAKDIVYILDTSGSMVGDKMEQAKKALQYCLHQLNGKDNFNIVSFSTEATTYKDKLISASKSNVKQALDYVDEEIFARGGTNLDEALTYAIDMAPKNSSRPYMIILLTDGKPTIGVTNAEQIIKKVQKANLSNLRLFSFGIGDQLNAKLLDRLAEENNGTREYVSAKEDIEIKISNFVDKVSFPVLSDIKIQFPSVDDLRITEVYPRKFPDLFKGSSITLLGRFRGHGDQVIKVSGMIGGENKEFVYEVSFPEENTENSHVPRLWAVRKVGFLLDQIRLHGENDELKKEVIRLAKKFGIVTPYTSYLVVEDEINRVPTTTRPVPRRQREGWFGRGNAGADRAMKSESGKDAVQASQDIKEMKNAKTAYKKLSGKKGNAQKVIRRVDFKTFYLKNGVWCDSETINKDMSQKQRVVYLSDAYFALLKKYPKIGKFLAIGKEIDLLWNDTVFEIRMKK